MTCNALGSLWTKFCNKCAMVCDCSRNYNVIVGDVHPEAIARMQAILLKRENLREAVLELRSDPQPVQIHLSKESMPTGDDVEENRDRISAGIMAVAVRCLGQVSAGHELEPQESWCRLAAASAMAGIDLAEMIRTGKPLTDKESERLQAGARLVWQYGSPAALLWNMLQQRRIESEAGLINLERIGMLSGKQREILSLGLRQFGQAFLARGPFAEAGPGVQAVFIRAAKKFSKQFLQSYAGLSRWTEAPAERREREELSLIRTEPQQAARADSGIPDVDEKIEDMSRSLAHLVQEVEIRDRSLSQPQILRSGVVRAQLLAYANGIPARKIDEDSLTKAETERIAGSIPRLRALDGAILHLYLSLKRTIVWEELQDHYAFPAPVLKALKEELRTHAQFLADLGSCEELIGLKTYALALLFRMAEKFPQDQLRHFNGKYRLAEWASASRVHSPHHHTPSPEEARASRSDPDVQVEMAHAEAEDE